MSSPRKWLQCSRLKRSRAARLQQPGTGKFCRHRSLQAVREELRKRDYPPVVFDFEKPRNQTTIETVTLLARMARFVIADLSDAKSVLQELQAIVPSSTTSVSSV